jgi:hypothetical protein
MIGPSRSPAGLVGWAVARPVLACWTFVGLVTTAPYVVAAAVPPPGRAFAGTFHWIDDFYNYVSFVQQAEDGRFVYQNKARLEEHPPALVNLEWWTVGGLSRACGRRPFLAYRLFSLAVLAGFLLAADRALRRLGLPSSRRLPALLLVATGGGLGGLLFELTPRPVSRCADLSLGLFPFLEILANPHWLAATWLFLETLLAFDGSRAGSWRAVGLATVLGLVRPYDLVLVTAVLAASILLSTPARDWLRSFVPLLGLVPVALYNYWVFIAIPTFAAYSDTRYWMAPTGDFLLGLGPAAIVALSILRVPAGSDGERALRVRLWAWAGLAFVVVVARPVNFSQQFTIGAGLPLLLLAAVGASRARPWVLAGLVAALGTTAVVALRIVSRTDPNWHVPAYRRHAALAMRGTCRPGDLAFSPADIGLYTIGLTACRAFVSHPFAPGFEERQAQARAFYGDMPPPARMALLDAWRATHLVLPGDAGPRAQAWLGESSPFTLIARVGRLPGMASVYLRRRGPVPPPPS